MAAHSLSEVEINVAKALASVAKEHSDRPQIEWRAFITAQRVCRALGIHEDSLKGKLFIQISEGSRAPVEEIPHAGTNRVRPHLQKRHSA